MHLTDIAPKNGHSSAASEPRMATCKTTYRKSKETRTMPKQRTNIPAQGERKSNMVPTPAKDPRDQAVENVAQMDRDGGQEPDYRGGQKGPAL